MPLQIMKRNINKNERFACTIKDVKSIFSKFDIYISFGYLKRNFVFDSRDHKHPDIDGTIVSSASVHANTGDNSLCFYVVNKNGFTDENSKEFTEICLPNIYAWFESSLRRENTKILGALSSNAFVVSLYENRYYFYDYHY